MDSDEEFKYDNEYETIVFDDGNIIVYDDSDGSEHAEESERVEDLETLGRAFRELQYQAAAFDMWTHATFADFDQYVSYVADVPKERYEFPESCLVKFPERRRKTMEFKHWVATYYDDIKTLWESAAMYVNVGPLSEFAWFSYCVS